MLSLGERYRALLAQGAISGDVAQAQAVARLEALQRALRTWRRRSGLAALLRGSEPAPKGLYLYGPVGHGKTMLMDLFYETTTFRPKRRIHFHEFMAEVHDLAAQARAPAPGDPIPELGRRFAAATRLLCFDEFYVSDIADAMILGRLFDALFAEQVVVVATSNVPPAELYKGGLNRQLFLPFIASLERHMDVGELAAAKDFRLAKLAGQPLYFTPADAAARAAMTRLWRELTGDQPGLPVDLDVRGRRLTATVGWVASAVRTRRAGSSTTGASGRGASGTDSSRIALTAPKRRICRRSRRRCSK
jgi:cell division protein ZapE